MQKRHWHIQEMTFRLIAVIALGGVTACMDEVPLEGPDSGNVAGSRPSSEIAIIHAPGDMALNSPASDSHVPSASEDPDPDQDTLAQGAGEAGATPSDGVDRAVISDEQDFEAVSSRETIESDRDRLRRQREALQVVEPEDLPARPRRIGTQHRGLRAFRQRMRSANRSTAARAGSTRNGTTVPAQGMAGPTGPRSHSWRGAAPSATGRVSTRTVTGSPATGIPILSESRDRTARRGAH